MQTKQTWTVAGGTADTVMTALVASLRAQGWKDVTREGVSARARIGSRMAFRLLGAHLRAGRKRFPVRLMLSVAWSSVGVVVDATLSSDEGGYLVNLPAVERLFERICTDLFSTLQTATRAA